MRKMRKMRNDSLAKAMWKKKFEKTAGRLLFVFFSPQFGESDDGNPSRNPGCNMSIL